MARDSEDTADNTTPSTETKPKSEPRTRNGGKTTPPPEAPKAEAKKPEKAKDEPVTEPKKPEAEPVKEAEKPKAEEPKVIPPERTSQDSCAEALEVQVKKAQRDKDSCWDNVSALDKHVLHLVVMLSNLTPDTKTRYSGLVKEAEELMTAMKTRSDRIRVFTETIPANYGISPGDFTSEETLANALHQLYGPDSIYEAVALRDELDAHVPDARDKNAHESFVRLADGAVRIHQRRKDDADKAEAPPEEPAKPKAEEPKVVPPERTAQDSCAEALEVQLKKAQRDKDLCWDNLAALDRLSLNLAVMLSTLTSNTKIRYSGLVKEAEELMTAMKTRSDRIRVFTETIPAKHGVSPGDFASEEMLADALDCPVKATAFRDELAAHVPDARDKNTLDNFVHRVDGAIVILRQRKAAEAAKAQAEAEAEAKAETERQQDALRQEAERQARAHAPNPSANTSADEAARKREEDWLRGQQATAATPDPTPTPAPNAIANQLAVQSVAIELLELAVTNRAITGTLFALFLVACFLLFTTN